jgi:hypothetical protein
VNQIHYTSTDQLPEEVIHFSIFSATFLFLQLFFWIEMNDHFGQLAAACMHPIPQLLTTSQI